MVMSNMPDYRSRASVLACCMVILLMSMTLTAETLRVLDSDDRVRTLDELVPELSRQRVVFVGERHDRYHHHLAQLAVIRSLHEAGERPWAIGMEFIQQPFQDALDDYVAGRLDETELLMQTEYFERWGFDYRLYQPIFQYAREQGMPLIALNVAAELVGAVSRHGLDGLSAEQRAELPESFAPITPERRAELEALYRQHPETSGDFERFLEVQQVWDAGMAARAADYLDAHPDHGLIVLAGSGHMAPGSGIPERLRQRLAVPATVLLPIDAVDEGFTSGADYLLLVEAVELPAMGRMGIRLDFNGGVSALEVLVDSAAERAGIVARDRILAIDEQPVETWADIRLAMMNHAPGDRITVTVQRADHAEPVELALTLD